MDESLNYLLEANTFPRLRILVIGEAILDSYIEGSAGRLSREAPVPIVAVTRRLNVPGGAANTAANVAGLGAKATLLSVVGDDAEGRLLCEALADCGVEGGHLLVQPQRQTLAKHRVCAGDQVLVRFDQGSSDAMNAETEAAMADRLRSLYDDSDAVIVSDYGCGILTPRILDVLAELQASAASRPLLVDAKDLGAYRRVRPSVAKPNYDEAVRLLGLPELSGERARAQQIFSSAGRLLKLTGAQIIAATLDRDGALILERGSTPYRTYAPPVRHPRVAGAGDTYLAAMALALTSGVSTTIAAEFAATAAAAVVAKEGTAVCTVQDLWEHESAIEKRVTDLSRLARRLAIFRQQERRIVFTNGCFDILHRGHITYLNRAKALGDFLIVGVNSDESTRRLKGPGRPINSVEDRVQVLAAMSCVDQLVVFDEDTPSELIRLIRPDIYVKGGDYTHETLPEAELVETLGGTVRILPYVEARSTTSIIERIRATAARPADGPASPSAR